MNWKEFATDYLSFSKKEQIAVIVLVALIVLVFLAPTVAFKKNNVKAKPVDTAWMTAVKNLEQKVLTQKIISQMAMMITMQTIINTIKIQTTVLQNQR
jgi:hypothetical protein